MNDPEFDPNTEEIPLEHALEVVARRLAGVTAAVDGFAERQQDLLGRDYSEDLALIHQSCEELRQAVDALAQKPALALTPEMIGRQIEAAGQGAHREAIQALVAAQGSLQSSIGALSKVTGFVRAAKRQNQMLAGAAGLALILGWVGGCIIPPAIDWIVPKAWHWPEKRAASALRLGGWEARGRPLSSSNPARWNDLRAAVQVYEENVRTIEACAKRASDRQLETAGCSIEVRSRY